MASLQDAHKAPPLPKYSPMLYAKRHLTLKYQRHLPGDISAPMPPPLGPLRMTSAASAEAMNNGCCRHKELSC
eukprot:6043610-Karenia_brevis.AAC.1